jgi:hypothetical protein
MTEPTSEHVIFAQGFLLRAQARFPEAIALLEHLIERAPNNSNAFRQLGVCKMVKEAMRCLTCTDRSVWTHCRPTTGSPATLSVRRWRCSAAMQKRSNGSSGHWRQT